MSTIIVLGAGMVGVCTALALAERGHEAVLIDRREPGNETSFGNAGVIQAEAVEPYAFPRDLPSLLRIALRRGNDVRYHFDALPGQAIALWQYFRASRPDRHRVVASQYARMIRRSTADHQRLIIAAGADNLIRRDGFYQVFTDGSRFEAAAREATRLAETYGVGVETLGPEAMRRAEPALRTGLSALRWTEPWTCNDPGGLVAAYAQLFSARGGTVVTGDASTLQANRAGWSVSTSAGMISAEQVVVALGPWSPNLLGRFGYSFRMIYKRGYHRHYRNVSGLRITVHDAEAGMVIAPMKSGLRITTGAELAVPDAPLTPRQLNCAVTRAGRLIELGAPVEETPWMGRRPCMPGMLPFVGRLPKHQTLWGNFGHGHQGFTLGPTTGLMLADQISEPLR